MLFKPILGRTKSFRSQIWAVLGVLVISVLAIIEISNGIIFYDLASQQRQIQLDNFRQSTIKQLQMQDRAFHIVEEQADLTLRKLMTSYQGKYQEANGSPQHIDLMQLKANAGEHIDFFIIDKNDVVRYTTFPPDQDLDFRKFPFMESFIQKVWQTNQIITTRTSSGVHGGVKKYVYQRTADEQYILELGMAFYTEKYFANFGIDNWKKELADDAGIIDSINVYNFNGHSFSSQNFTIVEGPQRQAFDRAVMTGERQVYEAGNRVYEYNVVPREGGDDTIFVGMVMEMVYDNAGWKQVWYKQIIFQLGIALFAIILFGFTSQYLARKVAKPINQISDHVKMIAAGNFDHSVKVEAGAEIQQLANNIDFMRVSMREGKQQIIEAYESSLRAFLTAIEFREQSTAVHSFEVNHIAIEIAKKMGLSEDEIRDLNWGTLLHDLGKLAIPDSILLKPGPLDDQELDLIRQHPRMGYEILKGASYFKNAIEISLYHHERYDGKGYPNALKGEAIPLLARICAVADTFQAMIDDRPYRKGLPVEVAIAEIQRCSGTQFDPVVVNAFLQIDHSCYPDRLKNRLHNQLS